MNDNIGAVECIAPGGARSEPIYPASGGGAVREVTDYRFSTRYWPNVYEAQLVCRGEFLCQLTANRTSGAGDNHLHDCRSVDHSAFLKCSIAREVFCPRDD